MTRARDIADRNVDSTTIDGVDSTQLLRSDVADTKTAGNLTFSDSVRAVFGDSLDLQVYHGGGTINHIVGLSTHSTYITGGTDLYLRGVNGEEGVTINGNGAVELFHDNSKKFETTNRGVDIDSTGSGSVAGIKVTKDIESGTFFQATYNGTINTGRSYRLLSPSTDSGAEPFVWETGNSHAFNTDNVERLKIHDSGIDVNGFVRFEGSTADSNETTLTVTDPTADRTITLPDATGTVLLTDGDGSNLTGINTDLVSDTTPQLGGNLDLNSNNITGTGDINITGAATITTADNTTQLTLKSTDADASEGPRLDLRRDSASPADNDSTGTIRFLGDNSDGSNHVYAEIQSSIRDVTSGTTDAELQFMVRRNGNLREGMMINEGIVTFNESGDDVDFRVESDGNANMLFVNGGTNRVGIGTGSPSTTLHVNGDITANNLAIENTPIVIGRKGSSQSVPRATWTKITGMTSDEYDTDSAWNGSRFTVPSGKAGRYLISAFFAMNFVSAGGDGEQAIGAIYVNGSSIAQVTRLSMNNGGRHMSHFMGTGAIIANLSVSDYVELYAFMQDDSQSGTLNVVGGSGGTRFGIMRIN